ncbi:MAG: hypothetical protein ABWY55_10115 [Microbacterium sp.]
MTTIAHHVRRPARESTSERRTPVTAVPTQTDDLRIAIARAIETSRTALAEAQHALRKSELVRRQAAAALEADLRPMRLDEAGRAALREAYATADADVAAKQHALDRARSLDDATRRVCAELDSDAGSALAAVLRAQLRAS